MLKIRLLGQFDVRLDGKRVTISSRAGQSLLAYLTLTAGTSHRREKLAGVFWPETTDKIARKNLRQELWRIRKALAVGQSGSSEYILADDFTLKFNRNSEYWLDVLQMERPDLDLQSLIANLSLYQGELLPGFYDEWIAIERERVQAVFEGRMEQLLEQLILADRWIAVQEWGERWLTLSGVREPAFRALMLASNARGNMAKVASLYERCIDELDEYLSVEPSTETRTLYQGLLTGAKKTRTAIQPTGTITFLFSDIEGSTRLHEKLDDQYAVALNDHHEIFRKTIHQWNGREMDTQGDSFFVTFTRALDAVQCAAEIQRLLNAHSWPQEESLRVRMGLHTGEPLIASTGYVGMDIHRSARIGDAGHGGQILLSQTTHDLVVQDLPKGVSIRDLGEYRLKDMKIPTSIYQLEIEGLPNEYDTIRIKFTGSEVPTPGEAPFKGLQFFDEADADLFFGRERLTAKIVRRLHDADFLSVIIGASGSGKSSLVRAGVVPAIKKGGALINGTKAPKGSASWQVHILTPTAHPLEALAIELTRGSESVTAAETLTDDLSKDPRSLHYFLSREAQTQKSSSPPHTLLVIDQFEELFTLCRDKFEREAFIDNLFLALNPSSHPIGEDRRGDGYITLIITLRADFYAALAQYPELRDEVAKQQVYIGPMTPEELRLAIEEPARRGHWEFEPGLVDLILRDVGDEPGALPLLSHALLETWKRRTGHTLTLKGYADAGSVHGAIAHTAESVFQSFSLAEQKIMRNILLRLTEFGEGTEDTRRRTTFDELMSQAEDARAVSNVLNKLADARLVTLSEDTAEVAHEALIREWSQLRDWLNKDREGIILHRHLTEAAQEWELLEYDTGSLFRGTRLAQVNEWFSLNPNALNAQEKIFLEASNKLLQRRKREREEQRERELAAAKELAETQRQSSSRLRIRNRVITGVGAIAIILALLAGVFGWQSNQNAINAQNNAEVARIAEGNALDAQATAEAEGVRAESEKELATARELAIAAVSNLNIDPERSILLALQSLYQVDTLEGQEALHQAIIASRVQLTLNHADSVGSIVYSPDGTRLATASEDGTAKIWDAATGHELLTLNTGPLSDVEFSPSGSGTRLATAYYESEIISIWDSITGQELLTLTGHTGGINRIAFSPDGTRLASASEDNTAKLWDASTGEELLTFSSHSDFVVGVAFSPDGTRLVTGSWDKTARIWDTDTGQELSILDNFSETVEDVAFSPDGRLIAITSFGEHIVFIWDTLTGQAVLDISGQETTVYDLAFSPDGGRIATANLDGTAKVWNAATGKEILTLTGHSSSLAGIAFSPDGKYLATASDDGTAKVWDITSQGSREWLTITAHTESVRKLAYSPDGALLVTASNDGTAKIFDAETGTELRTLSNHTANVYTAIFSPDGTRLATSSWDNTAKVWDAATGQELLTLSGHGDGTVGGFFSGILSVAYSPDGKKLATAGADGNTILWDATTGEQLMLFSNDGSGITNIAFSPDGKYLAIAMDQPPAVGIGEDALTELWDLATGQRIFVVGQAVRIWGLAFNNTGNRFATTGFGGIIKIRDVTTGLVKLDLSGHTSTVGDVVFSPDDSMVATTARDGAKLWDANTGKELLKFTVPASGVAFSLDGTRLAIGGRDGTVRIFLLKIEELIRVAESRVTRSLTAEECQRYLHLGTCPNLP